MNTHRLILLSLLAGALSSTLIAQTGMSPTGRILDDLGQPVVGAKVSFLADPDQNGHFTNFNQSTATDANGAYGFTNVPIGHYRVCVTAPGGGLVDPCIWESAAPKFQVAAAAVAAVPDVTVRHGYLAELTVSDPTAQFASVAAKQQGAVFQVGVWPPNGLYIPLSPKVQNGNAVYQVYLPYGVRAQLTASCTFARLDGSAIAGSSHSVNGNLDTVDIFLNLQKTDVVPALALTVTNP